MSVHTETKTPIVRTLECRFWPEATVGRPMPTPFTLLALPDDPCDSSLAIVPVDPPCTWTDVTNSPSPDSPSPATVPLDPESTWTDVTDEPKIESSSDLPVGHAIEEEWVCPPLEFY